ncbi:response regulator transcription factor [Porticoccus sp. W117]|uniref:response regulator transcription factor n=1 Tax=Porticoccus sp. W117 TaxID=3054777 RepID=UPI0025937EA4|nr:response regulator transcription factor [Porticoccus sp. W117]MDM3870182.1 response regulator transcription factor [Porticoccus sp. W117]
MRSQGDKCTGENYTVCILEDEQLQADMMSSWLAGVECQVICCNTSSQLKKTLQSQTVDLFVLDWLLPDTDGLQVLKYLRQDRQFSGPILFSTQLETEDCIVRALDAGADDYLVKPLREKEFVARVSALKRRANQRRMPEPVFQVGPIQLDMISRTAYVDGEAVKMRPKEFELAACLLARKGQLLTREYLLNEVWGVDADIDTRTVDMHMSRVRKALKIGPETGYYIKTVYQHGYRFEELNND